MNPPFDYPGTWEEWWAEPLSDRLRFAALRYDDEVMPGWCEYLANVNDYFEPRRAE